MTKKKKREEAVGAAATAGPTTNTTASSSSTAAETKKKESPPQQHNEQSAAWSASASGVKKDDNGDDGSLDIGACCLCHSALDYSDRAAFFEENRHEDYDDDDDDDEDPYFFRVDDPYLPLELYDPQNALVYCDGCDRMYHQKCHFVPLVLLPRGDFHCMVCQSRQHLQQQKKKKQQRKKKSKSPAGEQKKNSGRAKKGGNGDGRCNDGEIIDDDAASVSSDLIFQSPPCPAAADKERSWEEAAAAFKSSGWKREVAKIRRYCQTQLGQHRLATTAWETLTSTQRNRQHFLKNMNKKAGSSQEVAQTLCKLTAAKWKIREVLENLEQLLTKKRRCIVAGGGGGDDDDETEKMVTLSDDEIWNRLVEFCSSLVGTKAVAGTNTASAEDFIQRVIFPFGNHHGRRVEPRTRESLQLGEPETLLDTAADAVPAEIVLSPDRNEASRQERTTKAGRHRQQHRHKSRNMTSKKKGNEDNASRSGDDDSGISLDDLQCCVCLKNHATDENDLILCDGRGCFRAYHMHCVQPHVNPEDVDDEDEDWFCPLCKALAELMHNIQSEYMGDDWDQARFARHIEGKPTDGTLESWDRVADVFPEAKWEYETACKLRDGIRDADTRALLTKALGYDSPAGLEDDEDEDDEHFDPDAFEEQKRKRREAEEDDEVDDGDDDDSINSSQATLAEMSVELKIDRAELAALNSENVVDDNDESSEEDSEEEVDELGLRVYRRSRRLEKRAAAAESGSDSNSDPGKLDESNILPGKRNRKKVDYRKLNDAMFGDAFMPEIDGGGDFRSRVSRRDLSEAEEESDEDEESSSDEDDNLSTGNHGDSSSCDEESNVDDRKVAAKKRPSKQASVAAERSGGQAASRSSKKPKRKSDSTGGSKGGGSRAVQKRVGGRKKSDNTNSASAKSAKASSKRGPEKSTRARAARKSRSMNTAESKNLTRASVRSTKDTVRSKKRSVADIDVSRNATESKRRRISKEKSSAKKKTKSVASAGRPLKRPAQERKSPPSSRKKKVAPATSSTSETGSKGHNSHVNSALKTPANKSKPTAKGIRGHASAVASPSGFAHAALNVVSHLLGAAVGSPVSASASKAKKMTSSI